MKNSHRTNLARLVVTGSAAVVLGLAGSGMAMASELPTIPGAPECVETGECESADAPGAEPADAPGAGPADTPGAGPADTPGTPSKP